MAVKTVPTYDSPCRMPNGLQWFEDELFVMDQQSDQVYVMNSEGYVTRVMDTPTENGSGITVGGGFLWTASNGITKFRDYRPTDTHIGWIYQLDLKTGAFVNRWRTPDGGGIHGLEWDDGKLWVTAFQPKAIHICDPFDNMTVMPFEQPQHASAHVQFTRHLSGAGFDGEQADIALTNPLPDCPGRLPDP